MQDVWVPAPCLILPDEDQTGAETFKMTVALYIGDIPKSVSPYLPKFAFYIGDIPKSVSPYLPKLSCLKPPLICNFYFSPKTVISGGKTAIPAPLDQKVLTNGHAW